MRNLNLSRLARASEGLYFKDTQTAQASALRKQLTKQQINDVQASNTPKSFQTPTTDVLPEIYAHTAYKPTKSRLISQIDHSHTNILSRISNSSNITVTSTNLKSDPPILRALGSSKLQMYSSIQAQTKAKEITPLPGSTRYADGAVLGLASFSAATAIVASVGLAGVIILYTQPQIVQAMKDSTKQLANRMDQTIGKRLRERVENIRHKGPLIDDTKRQKATQFAHGAVGIKSTSDQEQLDNTIRDKSI